MSGTEVRVCEWCGAPSGDMADAACRFCQAVFSPPSGPPPGDHQIGPTRLITSFSLVLLNAGDQQIQVIEAVCELTGLRRKAATKLVDSVNPNQPAALAHGLDAGQARRWVDILGRDGALVEIRPPIGSTLPGVVPPDPELSTDGLLYGVYLLHVGAKKIQVIKEVFDMTGLGLKEAKDLVDSGADRPLLMVGGLTYRDAQSSVEKLLRAGAQADVCTTPR